MTTVQLGVGAYRRKTAGAPEIKCLNRWVEKSPDNPREHIRLLSRPGTTPTLTFNPGTFGLKSMRGNYTLNGLFDDSLFVVCGNTLYRVRKDMSITAISGTIQGTGYPEVAWQKGEGYERLWIADGLLLQFYDGTTHANSVLTLTGSITAGTDKIAVGGVYYGWSTSVNTGTPNGTSGSPFLVLSTGDPMANLIAAINNSGTSGVTYSSTITAPSTIVSATALAAGPPVTSITFTAVVEGTPGNAITTTIPGGTALSWTGATLANGGIDSLQGCTVPDGQAAKSLSQVSGYVLVSILNSQKFYWVLPGDVTIDGLSFAEKESSPDNILSLRAVGDQVLIIGEKSTENWYATGDSNSPFAPIEGRVYQRGAIDGTAVVVDEGIYLVGDDGRVYSVGYSVGQDVPWGVNRVSDNGIEERIRRQLRNEAGLTP